MPATTPSRSPRPRPARGNSAGARGIELASVVVVPCRRVKLGHTGVCCNVAVGGCAAPPYAHIDKPGAPRSHREFRASAGGMGGASATGENPTIGGVHPHKPAYPAVDDDGVGELITVRPPPDGLAAGRARSPQRCRLLSSRPLVSAVHDHERDDGERAGCKKTPAPPSTQHGEAATIALAVGVEVSIGLDPSTQPGREALRGVHPDQRAESEVEPMMNSSAEANPASRATIRSLANAVISTASAVIIVAMPGWLGSGEQPQYRPETARHTAAKPATPSRSGASIAKYEAHGGEVADCSR